MLLIFSLLDPLRWNSGPAEVGVQGVPRHTQYLVSHLGKTMSCTELGFSVHTQYSVASIDPDYYRKNP